MKLASASFNFAKLFREKIRENFFARGRRDRLGMKLNSEGGIISVNSLGNFGEDSSSSCTGTDGFCDRSYELRNQLYWKGFLATKNTIGGADKSSFECPDTVSCDSRETARIYDLAYLRTYHTDSGGVAANGAPSGASFVAEYDARIPNNTPPLFDIIGESTKGEI